MKLWIVSGALHPGCAEDPPSDDGDQNDKQRSCFWWFMEVGDWGSMTQRDSVACGRGGNAHCETLADRRRSAVLVCRVK